MRKQQVSTLEVLRAFYTADVPLKTLDRTAIKDEKAFRAKLRQIVKKVGRMNASKVLGSGIYRYGPRFDNYFNSRWTLKRVKLADCGVWPRMRSLPDAATRGTVLDTAEYLRPYLEGKKKGAPRRYALYLKKLGRVAEAITEHVPIIVLEGGVIRHNKLQTAAHHKAYVRCRYDIDDGNSRAIALALTGKTEVLALVGKRIHKNPLLYF